VAGDCRDTGGDKNAYSVEPAQLVHHGRYLPSVCSLRIENGLYIVEDDEDLPGGKEGSEGYQILGIIDPCTNDFGQPSKEMSTRGWELIAADESPVVAKSVLDATVVKDGESYGSLPNPPCTDEGSRFEIFGKTDHLFNEVVPSETGPGWRGRQLSRRNTTET
jgi:hypothetical protein